MTVSHETTFPNIKLLSLNEDGTLHSENCEHMNCYSHQILSSPRSCLHWQATAHAIENEARASMHWYFPVHSSATSSSETSQAQVLSALPGVSDGFLQYLEQTHEDKKAKGCLSHRGQHQPPQTPFPVKLVCDKVFLTQQRVALGAACSIPTYCQRHNSCPRTIFHIICPTVKKWYGLPQINYLPGSQWEARRSQQDSTWFPHSSPGGLKFQFPKKPGSRPWEFQGEMCLCTQH